MSLEDVSEGKPTFAQRMRNVDSKNKRLSPADSKITPKSPSLLTRLEEENLDADTTSLDPANENFVAETNEEEGSNESFSNYLREVSKEINKLTNTKEAKAFYEKELEDLFLRGEVNPKGVARRLREMEMFKLPTENGFTPESVRKLMDIKSQYERRFFLLQQKEKNLKAQDKELPEYEKAVKLFSSLREEDKNKRQRRSVEIKFEKKQKYKKSLDIKARELSEMENAGPLNRLFSMGKRKMLRGEIRNLEMRIKKLGG